MEKRIRRIISLSEILLEEIYWLNNESHGLYRRLLNTYVNIHSSDKKTVFKLLKLIAAIMDEEAGRRASPRAAQSDHQDEPCECAQCAELGKVVSAAGFCVTCADYLCTSCIEEHKILRGLKDHELLESDYVLSEAAISKTDKCAIHSGRPIEAYCKDEDIFGCLACFTVGHKSCKNFGLISVLSQEIETSKEFLDVQKATERFNTLTEEYRQAIQKLVSLNEGWQTKTLEDFQKFRSDILSMLDEIGEDISKEAEKLKDENEKQLTGLAELIEKYSEQVTQYCVNIDNNKARKKKEQLFLTLKKNGREVMDAVQHMEILHHDIFIRTLKFNSDPSFKANLSESIKIKVESTDFLSVQCTPEAIKESNTINQPSLSPATTCTSESKVNIKSPEDERQCWVTSIMELSPTQLILSDFSNKCLKLIDLTNTSSTVIRRRVLESAPMDITKLPKNRVAVSLPFIKQIQILTADQSLEPCESIIVSGGCLGLQCTGDQFVVSFSGPQAQIRILDHTGNVLHSIQHDAVGKALFESPLYHKLSSDNKRIYVSDISKHTVTCMATTGAIQWVYQNHDLKSPKGVSPGDDGSIFVCSSGTSSIHVISSDGSRLAVIPQCQSGVELPQAVCYSSYHHTLFLSSEKSEHRNYISKLILQ